MGFRFHGDLGVLPCDMVNGVLRIYIGEEIVLQHKIDKLLAYSFPKQCNMVNGTRSSICCYMVNGAESLVLRYNGSGTIYLNKEGVFYQSFEYTVVNPELLKVSEIGIVKNVFKAEFNSLWLCEFESGEYYLNGGNSINLYNKKSIYKQQTLTEIASLVGRNLSIVRVGGKRGLALRGSEKELLDDWLEINYRDIGV